jgi:prevent-host-death family protein
MNRRVSVAEAKNNLPAIIHEVEQGSLVEITRHGRALLPLLSPIKIRTDYRSKEKDFGSL